MAALLSAHYGQGNGPVLLDNVQCFGNELDLFTCAHNGFGYHNCKHDKDASVECSGMYIHNYVWLHGTSGS